jgi:hypothetical protein
VHPSQVLGEARNELLRRHLTIDLVAFLVIDHEVVLRELNVGCEGQLIDAPFEFKVSQFLVPSLHALDHARRQVQLVGLVNTHVTRRAARLVYELAAP